MKEEIEKSTGKNRVGNATAPLNEAASNTVSNILAYQNMWQKVFNKLPIFGDAEALAKNNFTINNELKINPNWPLRDGDL